MRVSKFSICLATTTLAAAIGGCRHNMKSEAVQAQHARDFSRTFSARGAHATSLPVVLAKVKGEVVQDISVSESGAIAYSSTDATGASITRVDPDGKVTGMTGGHFDTCSSFTPEGSVVFSRGERGQPGGKICKVALNGKLTSLTQGPVDWQPAVSPDGKLIAFTRMINSEKEHQYTGRLMIMNSDGTGVRDVTPQALSEVATASWSGTGSLLIFGATPDGARHHMYSLSTRDYKTFDQLSGSDDLDNIDPMFAFDRFSIDYLQIPPALGRSKAVIKQFGYREVTIIAPDPKRLVQPNSIVFRSKGFASADFNGKLVAQLPFATPLPEPVAISDGGVIAFAKKESASTSVFLAQPDGTQSKETVGHFDRDPTFSPDQLLVFSRADTANGPHRICRTAIHEHDVQELTKGFDDRSPAVSRHGKVILFTRATKAANGSWSSPRLMRVKTDGLDAKDITPAGLSDVQSPSWSLSGGSMLFSAKGKNGHRHIYSLSAREDATCTQLTSKDQLEDTYPSYMDEGDSIVYASTPTAGGPTKLVLHRAGQPNIFVAGIGTAGATAPAVAH